jgi:SMODS-associated and fused to various effectors sensor domain
MNKPSRRSQSNKDRIRGKRAATEASKKQAAAARTKSTSLVSSSGMGGIIGGKGYDFQSRYIACHVPEWLLNGAFTAILPEGTGDVDVLYGSGKKERRDHIQIKDHPVTTKTELREIIDTFASFEKAMPNVYQNFILACPSLGPVVQPLKNALERLRNASPFFKSAPGSLTATRADVKKRIVSLGPARYENFILDKVHFHIGLPDFHDDKAACNQFALKLLDLPEYKEKVIHLIKPAYPPVLNKVASDRGKVLDRVTLKSLIDAALRAGKTEPEPAIDLDVHNWTFEKYDREPQHVIDWSPHFDRDTRTIPDEKMWNEQLVPEIYALRKRLAKETDVRLIRLRGKNALTTGILLGAAFPQIGGWVFEIPQPPKPEPWRSDAPPQMNYGLQVQDEVTIDEKGDSIAVVFNIKGSALKDVGEYIRKHSLPVKVIIPIAPEGDARALSIADDGEAVSLALAARDELRKALDHRNIRATHLFFYGPFALAVFVSQLLTSIGRVHLYEFKDPGYIPSATIRT